MLLKDLEKLARTPAPWNKNGCTVTVQSASKSHKKSLKTLLSPSFAHFNKPKNCESIRNLKERWNGMRKEDKDKFRLVSYFLPSPQLATTMQLDKSSSNMDSLTIEFCQITVQGFPLTLFCDANFIKFCSLVRLVCQGLSD